MELEINKLLQQVLLSLFHFYFVDLNVSGSWCFANGFGKTILVSEK